LIPGLVHAAAVDALHGCAFEDHFFCEIEFDGAGRNAEERHAATETQDFESCSNGLGAARHFQHDINAGAARVVHHDAVHVVLGGIEHEIRAHLLRDLAAMFVYLDGEDLRGSAGARHRDGEQPDGAAAGDGHALGRDLTGKHSVDRVAQRVEDGGVFLRNRRIELPDVGLGDDDVFGESAVGVHADDLHVLADVRFADAALQALAARYVHLGGDEVARLDARNFVTDCFDRAAKLVAGNERRMNAALRPLVPQVNVQVGAADGRHLDLDQYVGRAKSRFRDFADFRARCGLRLDNGNHRIWHEDDSSPAAEHGVTSARYERQAVGKR